MYIGSPGERNSYVSKSGKFEELLRVEGSRSRFKSVCKMEAKGSSISYDGGAKFNEAGR